VLAPRIGEIIGGSQREERYDVLLENIRARGLPEEAYWWYLELRKYGSVPHAGFGLGHERMMMYLTGMKNIRDVIPFPRTPGYAEFRDGSSLQALPAKQTLNPELRMSGSSGQPTARGEA